MTFSYKEVKPGTILSSQDWNATMQEIVRLETAKVNRDGADTIKGPLTIAQALTINGTLGIGTPPNPDFRLDIKGNLRLTEGSITANLTVKDTRKVNDPPTAFDRVVSFDFKERETVAAPGDGTYSGMLTIAPWSDNSGDVHHQLNFNKGGIFWRQGQPDATSWEQWRRIPHEGMTNSFTFQGNLGIGLTNPAQALVINSAFNSGKQSDSGLSSGGAIAIRSDAPQIDFIDTNHKDWAIHVNSNKLYFIREPWEFKDLVLDGTGQVGIGTDAPQAKLQVADGAIMPSAGSTSNSGILFPANPGGGTEDTAWMRYYSRSGESSTLELGISNDVDDHIALMPSGGVGIGINNPGTAKLAITATTDHLRLIRPGTGTAGGRQLFLELFQESMATRGAEVYPCIRFHQQGWFWRRFEARPDGFHFKDGNLDTDDYVAIRAASVKTTTIHQSNDKFRLELQDDGNLVLYGANGKNWASNTHSSDITLKKEITAIPNALERLLSLRGVSFFWKDETWGQKREVGVIAQEVELAFPELMQTLKSEYKSVQYDKFAPILIEAIREQQQLIQDLQAEVEDLKKQSFHTVRGM